MLGQLKNIVPLVLTAAFWICIINLIEKCPNTTTAVTAETKDTLTQKIDTVYFPVYVNTPQNVKIGHKVQTVIIRDTIVENETDTVYVDNTYNIDMPIVSAKETYSNEYLDVNVEAVGFYKINSISIEPKLKSCPAELLPPKIECPQPIECPKRKTFLQKIISLFQR